MFLRFPVTLGARPKCAFLAARSRLNLRGLLPADRIFRLADVTLLPVLERLLVTLLTDPDPLVRRRAQAAVADVFAARVPDDPDRVLQALLTRPLFATDAIHRVSALQTVARVSARFAPSPPSSSL